MILLKNKEVFDAIKKELKKFKGKLFKKNKPMSLPGHFVAIENHLQKAKRAWEKEDDTRGPESVLGEVLQIAALAVSALKKYGLEGSTISTDDISCNNTK